jgi:TetR/AcrR family transcriptional repressor of mexJK operon
MDQGKALRAHRDPSRIAAIMNVAWEVFLEDGYAGASMSKIAERLGGSKSTLYNYFPSKDEVFNAVIRHKGEELYKNVMAFLPNSRGLRADLEEFGMRLVEVVLSDSYTAFYRLVIAEAVRFPGAGTRAFEARRSAVLGPLGERLRLEMARGRMPVANPLEAAETFWSLSSATLHRRALAGLAPEAGDAEIGVTVSRAVALFLNAYRWDDTAGKAQ